MTLFESIAGWSLKILNLDTSSPISRQLLRVWVLTLSNFRPYNFKMVSVLVETFVLNFSQCCSWGSATRPRWDGWAAEKGWWVEGSESRDKRQNQGQIRLRLRPAHSHVQALKRRPLRFQRPATGRDQPCLLYQSACITQVLSARRQIHICTNNETFLVPKQPWVFLFRNHFFIY